MSRPINCSLIATYLIVGSLVCAHVGEATEQGSVKPASKRARGTIESISTQAHTMTVKVTTGNKKKKSSSISNETFKLPEECRFAASGKKTLKLSDFKVGDEVIVTYSEQGSVNVASLVTLAEPKSDKDK